MTGSTFKKLSDAAKTFAKVVAIYAVPVFLMTACGPGSNTDPVDNAREYAKDKELQKTFKGECSLKPLEALISGIATLGDTSIKSAREDYEFDGANFNHVTHLFTTKDCSGAESISFREAGSFTIDEDKKTADSGKFITLEMNKLFVVINNQDGVTIAQSSKLCGTTDWSLQEEKDVTANAARVTCYRQEVPSVDENIYLVNGNTLVFGEKVGRSRERPTSLDMETKYIAN